MDGDDQRHGVPGDVCPVRPNLETGSAFNFGEGLGTKVTRRQNKNGVATEGHPERLSCHWAELLYFEH